MEVLQSGAFQSCEALPSIDLPQSLREIKSSAFMYCGSLESVVIPYGVTSIGDGAFGDCGALSYVEIPDTVTSIGSAAFALCRELTLSVPDSVTEIGGFAFNQVPQVYYSDPLGTGYDWGGVPGQLMNSGAPGRLFPACGSLKSNGARHMTRPVSFGCSADYSAGACWAGSLFFRRPPRRGRTALAGFSASAAGSSGP